MKNSRRRKEEPSSKEDRVRYLFVLIISVQVLKVTQIRINNFQDIGEKLKELGAP